MLELNYDKDEQKWILHTDSSVLYSYDYRYITRKEGAADKVFNLKNGIDLRNLQKFLDNPENLKKHAKVIAGEEKKEEAPVKEDKGEAPVEEKKGEAPVEEKKGETPVEEKKGEVPAEETKEKAPEKANERKVPTEEIVEWNNFEFEYSGAKMTYNRSESKLIIEEILE